MKEENTNTQIVNGGVADKTTSCIIGKALNKNNNSLLKLTEKVPAKAFKFILSLDEATYEHCYMKKVSSEHKTTLGALKYWAKRRLKNEDENGYITTEVTYKAKPNKPKGRLYAEGGINIQYLSKPLRGIMLGKDYKDIDISNCWFSIALAMCKHYEKQGGHIQYKCLNYYVNYRNQVFDKMNIPKEQGKELFSTVWNTDSFNGVNEPFIIDFYNEKCKIINTIINDEAYISQYDDLDIIRKSPTKPENNMSAQMWYLISIIETYEVLEKLKDVSIGTYLYDGAMVLKDTPFHPTFSDGICWVQKPIDICPIYLAWKPKNQYHEKIYNAVWGSMNIKSATFRHCSDWLLSEVGDKLAYCDKSIYKCNKNNVWEIVDNGDGDLLKAIAKHLLHHIKKEQAKAQEKLLDEDDPTDKHIVKRWNTIIDYLSGDAGWLAFRNIVIGESKMKNPKFPEKLDLLKEHICFANKKYELNTGLWSDIVPQDYISITTGYNYEEPTQDVIDKLNEMYLNKIFVDSADREHFMKSMCAVLDGNIRRRKMNIFTNAGSNGKSVICDMLAHMLGKYHNSAPSTLIQRNKASSGSANPELFRFKNCRMIQMNEPDKGEKMNSAFIKELTGGDIISGRQLHSNQIVQFKPTASLCMLANDIPALDVTDPATLGRMNVIPFNSTFRSDIIKDDWENKEFIADDSVLECYNEVKIAMFNEIVKYYSEYLKNTNWSYKSELGQEYMDSQDFVKQLLDTYTEKSTGAERVNVKDLYELMKMDDTFKEHCPSSQRKFNGILRNKALKIEKSHSAYVIRGFKLKSSENEIECMIDDLDC